MTGILGDDYLGPPTNGRSEDVTVVRLIGHTGNNVFIVFDKGLREGSVHIIYSTAGINLGDTFVDHRLT